MRKDENRNEPVTTAARKIKNIAESEGQKNRGEMRAKTSAQSVCSP